MPRDVSAYVIDGMRVPSVTEGLHIAGMSNFGGIPPSVLEHARRRGGAVHEWTDGFDQEYRSAALLPATMEDFRDECLPYDSELHGYCRAWVRFRIEMRFSVQLIEHAAVSVVGRYAGTVDRTGTFADSEDVEVVDTKCVYALSPVTALQTAGYAMLDGIGGDGGNTMPGRRAVQLRPDGTYRTKRYVRQSDFADWMGIMRSVHFKLRNGLAEIPEHSEDNENEES